LRKLSSVQFVSHTAEAVTLGWALAVVQKNTNRMVPKKDIGLVFIGTCN
jgi:hypothetical protein